MIKYKIYKDFKISTMITIQILITIILISSLGLVSMVSSKKTLESTRHISEVTSQSDKYISNIKNNVLEIRLETSRKIDSGYKIESFNVVKSKNEEIKDYVNTYLKLPYVSQNEKSLLLNVKTEIDKYNKKWDNIRYNIINKLSISEDSKKDLENTSYNIMGTLNKLEEANKHTLKVNNALVDKHLVSSQKTIVAIMVLVILISLVFSFFLILYINKSINSFRDILESVSKLDFSVYINSGKNEFGVMKEYLKNTLNAVSSIINEIKEKATIIENECKLIKLSSSTITSATIEVSSSIKEIAKGSNTQCEKLDESTSTIEVFNKNLNHIIENIKDVDISTEESSQRAKENSFKLQEVVYSITELKTSFKNVSEKVDILSTNILKVSEITEFINSLAEKTNLLSLNASIEAARAGESGRGFAVVANEIRNLAEQSKKSALDINSLIENVTIESKDVENTTKLVEKKLEKEARNIESSINEFKNVIYSIETIAPKVEVVTNKIEELDKDKNEILENIKETSLISEEFSCTAEEISKSGEEVALSCDKVEGATKLLHNQAVEMLYMVEKFKLFKE